MKQGRVAWAFSFVVVTTSLSLASSGCVSVYATKHGFEGTTWPWASQDCVETTFGPPWSEANVDLSEAKDHSVLLAGKFAGVRCGAGSPEERLLLGNALDSGVLRMRDEVYASYQITSGWMLPGAEEASNDQPRAGGGYLGVSVAGEDDDEQAGSHVLVKDVAKGSPAAKAGIRAGDRIAALDGKYLTDAKSLHAFMADAVAGRAVHATLLREGKELELEVTIGERQSEAAPAPQGHAVGATTGLILANDGEMCFVLARTTKGWIRCRSQAIKCN